MPKDYFISDVHIQESDDEAAELFIKFLKTCLNDNAERVFLLGDIFDLMVGPYVEYEQKYWPIFEHFQRLHHSGSQIYFFEGNHDFHLKNFFDAFEQRHGLNGAIRYIKEDLFIRTPQGFSAHVSHGDDMEIENTGYKVYKKLINNRFVELFAEQILTFNFVEKLGQKASADSKKRNQKRYSKAVQQDHIRNKFRRSAEILAEKIDVDIIIAGHSHYKDDYQTSNGTRYMNNGYALQSKSFIRSDESGLRFIEL